MTFSVSRRVAPPHSQVWNGWKWLARLIGEFNARVLLTLLYAVLVVPVGLILRLAADPLRRRRPDGSHWTPRPPVPATLDEARRQ